MGSTWSISASSDFRFAPDRPSPRHGPCIPAPSGTHAAVGRGPSLPVSSWLYGAWLLLCNGMRVPPGYDRYFGMAVATIIPSTAPAIAPDQGLAMHGQPIPADFPKYPMTPPTAAPMTAPATYLNMSDLPDLQSSASRQRLTTPHDSLLPVHVQSDFLLTVQNADVPFR
jgi:hypothetical protein